MKIKRRFFLHEKERSRFFEYLFVDAMLFLVILSLKKPIDNQMILYTLLFFILNFKITWSRERRRTLQESDDKKINADLIEASLLLTGILSFLIYTIIKKIPYSEWHPYFTFACLGLVNGSFLSEFLWRRFSLKSLTNIEIQRYWANARGTIILPHTIFK